MTLISALLGDVPESHFQAAWYYSLVVAGMFSLILLGSGWALRGAARIWRDGDHAAGAVIAAATLTTLSIFVGILIAGIVGLVATGGTGCCGP
jgi:hypothetical protein